MKKLYATILLVGAMFVLSMNSIQAADNSIKVNILELNGSGDSAIATLTEVGGNSVHVVIEMQGAMPMEHTNHPAHIHKGTCANLDPKPAYPLNTITEGKSDTTVMVSLQELLSGSYAINLHESPQEATTYIACGEIKDMAAGTGVAAPGMPSTGHAELVMATGGMLLVALLLMLTGLKIRRQRA